MEQNKTATAKIISTGAPIFRKPGTSHEELAEAWHRHGQLVTPWCLNAGIWEYIQIHMPSAPSLSASSTSEAAQKASDEEEEEAIKSILRQADGFAIMRRREGMEKEVEEKGKRYFETVVLVDERRFLHDESGAGAVKGNPPVYDVPEVLDVDVWREVALSLGGVEYVKIRDGKDVAGGAFWDEWERVEKETERAGVIR
ncbi:hypothetical protein HD806DRAFT_535517 [Xylariaceae sp. AK1471]|nr:hypothetical protein HD806DRAFT_535517 [Xylariaceae sp. AK1471]